LANALSSLELNNPFLFNIAGAWKNVLDIQLKMYFVSQQKKTQKTGISLYSKWGVIK